MTFTPAADSTDFILTFDKAYTTAPICVISAGNADSATDLTKIAAVTST